MPTEKEKQEYERSFKFYAKDVQNFLQIVSTFTVRGLISWKEMKYDFKEDLFVANIEFATGEDYILFNNTCTIFMHFKS